MRASIYCTTDLCQLFFKRGEGNRISALRLFSVITRELILKVAGLDVFVVDVVTQAPLIFDKALGE